MKPRLSPETDTKLLKRLVTSGVGTCVFNAPLAGHTSWQIGGPADLLVEPESADQVANVVRFANSNHIPLIVIGQGTC